MAGDPTLLRRPLVRAAVAVVGLVAVALVAALALPDWRGESHPYLTKSIGEPDQSRTAEPLPAEPTPMARLAAAGDVGTGEPEAAAVASAMNAAEIEHEYDAVLLLGDNVYPDGAPELVGQVVLDPYRRVLDGGTELLAVLGNHDVADGHADEHARAIGMPGRWYAADLGDVLIVALDSNEADDPQQLEFLDETLAASDERWVIVTMHQPPFSAGWHGPSEYLQDTFVPILADHGVQLVLAGHEHDYQRFEPIDGVTYVVSGGGGADLRPTGRNSSTAAAWSTYHFVDLVVWEDRLVLRAIDRDGRVFDEVVLTPNRAAAQP